MIAGVFLYAGIAAAGAAFVALIWGATARRFHGLAAIANGLMAASDAFDGARVGACCASAVCAYAAWRWWNSGGGDGTKRRLKSWARRFRGVRRTAPVLGGA